MQFNINNLKLFLWPGLCTVVIAFVATLAPQNYDWLLAILFLLMPFTDRLWGMPYLETDKQSLLLLGVLVCITSIVLIKHQEMISSFIVILLVVALPEEWFFRAYFMNRLGLVISNRLSANLITSIIFSLLHIPTQGWVGLAVFWPSLMFGWLYQVKRNLIVVVIVHALSNLIFIIYIKDFVDLIEKQLQIK